MNIKKLGCLFLTALLMFLYVDNTYASSAMSFQEALSNENFKQLSDFLESQGYTIEETQSVSTVITESSFAKEQKIALNMTVTLFPFSSQEAPGARIAFWSGYWDNNYYTGAIATVGESDIYLSDGKQVFPVERESLHHYIQVPLYALSGPVPPGLTETYTQSVLEDGLSEPSEEGMLLGCATVYRSRNGFTLLGFLAWTFNMSKYFCYNGSSVYNINVSTYVSNMDPNFYYRGIVSSADYPITNGHHSLRQGHIENCIFQYGCIGSYYPGIVTNVYNNGSQNGYTWQ